MYQFRWPYLVFGLGELTRECLRLVDFDSMLPWSPRSEEVVVFVLGVVLLSFPVSFVPFHAPIPGGPPQRLKLMPEAFPVRLFFLLLLFETMALFPRGLKSPLKSFSFSLVLRAGRTIGSRRILSLPFRHLFSPAPSPPPSPVPQWSHADPP